MITRMMLLTWLCVSLTQIAAQIDVMAQGPDGGDAEWEQEQDRRRADEGEHFDEAAYEFERAQMARRHERRKQIEERRMRLEDEMQQYWTDRQHADMDRHMEEWESEQERRREEEGEHFDEEAYQFEKGQILRRRELEERRISLEERMHEAFRELDGKTFPDPCTIPSVAPSSADLRVRWKTWSAR